MPGLIGRAYAEMGGTVHYVGKPHPAVYQACFQALDLAVDQVSSLRHIHTYTRPRRANAVTPHMIEQARPVDYPAAVQVYDAINASTRTFDQRVERNS